MKTEGIWAVLQHTPGEGPGLLAEELAGAGYAVQLIRPAQGEDLPPVGSIAGLTVLGGDMSANDDSVHPWLAAERELIANGVRAGLPVLGICLGAQQLARALGAEVTTGAAPEVGVYSVALTAPGRVDPVLGPEYGGLADPELPVVQWHGDTFSLPDGAVHLAGTRAFPHQAFRIGRRVYGFQFHPEVDRPLAEHWERSLPEGQTFIGDSRFTEATVVGRRVLRRFLDVAALAASER